MYFYYCDESVVIENLGSYEVVEEGDQFRLGDQGYFILGSDIEVEGRQREGDVKVEREVIVRQGGVCVGFRDSRGVD